MELNLVLCLFFLGFLRGLAVFGPLLFLLYINDLLDAIQGTLSHLNLFADNVLLYRIATCAANFLFLQEVIGCIEQLSTISTSTLLSVYKYMIVSHKRSPPVPLVPCTQAL